YHPRLIDHIRMIGASRFVSTPQERTLEVLEESLARYFGGKTAEGHEQIRLYRLAWELCGTPFGARQDLYERFFLKDPELQKIDCYMTMNKTEATSMVRRILSLDNDSGFTRSTDDRGGEANR